MKQIAWQILTGTWYLARILRRSISHFIMSHSKNTTANLTVYKPWSMFVLRWSHHPIKTSYRRLSALKAHSTFCCKDFQIYCKLISCYSTWLQTSPRAWARSAMRRRCKCHSVYARIYNKWSVKRTRWSNSVNLSLLRKGCSCPISKVSALSIKKSLQMHKLKFQSWKRNFSMK